MGSSKELDNKLGINFFSISKNELQSPEGEDFFPIHHKETIMDNIPPNISEVFEKLKIEATWLHVWWKIYRQLFAHSEKRINLLNECASACFYVIQEMLIEQVQIYICKLTDPACTGKYENLSFEQLQRRVEDQGEKQLSADLQKLCADLRNNSKPFHNLRNKRLVHLDLDTTMQSRTNAISGISRKMIEETLRIMRNYLNSIQIYYCHIETDYENFHMPGKDGEALVVMLKFALRYNELLKDGRFSFNNFEQGQWWDS